MDSIGWVKRDENMRLSNVSKEHYVDEENPDRTLCGVVLADVDCEDMESGMGYGMCKRCQKKHDSILGINN